MEEIRILYFGTLKYLNTSLQVGDILYGCDSTDLLNNPNLEMNLQPGFPGVGSLTEKGRVVKIEPLDIGWNVYVALNQTQLTEFNAGGYANNFMMFSKFNQSDGNITGYYAKCRFVNNSPDKADLFSIGSNVTESSK